MQIISRKDAKASNLKRYFTGKPCKHDHVAERFTTNGECIPCAVESRNRPERKQKDKEYRDRNKHKNRERAAKYYKDNIESVKIKRAEYSRRYKLENREEILRKSKEYRDRNREKIALKKKEK